MGSVFQQQGMMGTDLWAAGQLGVIYAETKTILTTESIVTITALSCLIKINIFFFWQHFFFFF